MVITNNPSTIDQNQKLLARFSNLSINDVIIPRSVRLAFEIEINSKDSPEENSIVAGSIQTAIKSVIRIFFLTLNTIILLATSDLMQIMSLHLPESNLYELDIQKLIKE